MLKKALLVGINSYPSCPLRGCVNDVQDMLMILRDKFGFKTENSRVVIDQRATTQGIKDRLKWLVSGLKSGDVWMFHYSGHGTQIRDRGPKDELADGMDECICPVDLDWEKKIITDDDISAILKMAPKGSRGFVVLDCCHSGSGTREIRPLMENPGPEHYQMPRYLPPPFDIEARSLGLSLNVRKLGRGILAPVVKRGWFGLGRAEITPISSLNHVLVGGCRSTETSADAYIGGRFNGALTWSLVSAMRELPVTTPVKDLFQKAVDKVKSMKFVQNPQLEAPPEILGRPAFY